MSNYNLFFQDTNLIVKLLTLMPITNFNVILQLNKENKVVDWSWDRTVL